MNIQDRQYLEAVIDGLKGVMEERFTTVFGKQDEMIEHQKITNGRVSRLEVKMACVEKNSRFSAWVARNPFKSIGILFLAVFIVIFFAEQFTLSDIIGLLK